MPRLARPGHWVHFVVESQEDQGEPRGGLFPAVLATYQMPLHLPLRLDAAMDCIVLKSKKSSGSTE